MLIVGLYIVSVVVANLLIAQFGPTAAIPVAFLLIGLDLTARDTLHERWANKNLWLKMAGLIVVGSVLSAALNRQVAQISVASFVAFAATGLTDTIVYHTLKDRVRFVRVNGSNVFSSAVDSFVFPALAFGFPLLVPIMTGQFLAKVLGGLLWSLLLRRIDVRPVS